MRLLKNLISRPTSIGSLVLLLTSTAFTQVGPGIQLTSVPNGLLVTGPASSQRFEMRVTGENAERLRTQKKYWFRANGIRFEFFSEENSRFLPTDIPYRLDDRAVLRMFRSVSSRRNGNPNIRLSWLKLANGKIALFWSYNKFVATPNRDGKNEREMFLVLAGPGNVFGLFAPVLPGGSEAATKRLLVRTLGSLTFSG